MSQRIHKYRYVFKRIAHLYKSEIFFRIYTLGEIERGLCRDDNDLVKLLARDEFTNLHDKNGVDPTVELYHKDLMAIGMPTSFKEKVFVIEWDEAYGWVLRKEGYFWKSLYLAIENEFAKKVGNFYENPNLLEEGEK